MKGKTISSKCQAQEFKNISKKSKFNCKNKNKNSNYVFNIEKLDKIKSMIFEDIKNINKLNTIIEEFLNLNSQTTNNKSTTYLRDYVYNTLKEIFEYLIKGNKQKLSLDLMKFLNEKLTLIINILIDLIDPEEDPNNLAGLICKPFEIYELKNFHLKYFDKSKSNIDNEVFIDYSPYKLDEELYERIIEKFILTYDLIEAENIKLLSENLLKNLDLTHLFKILKILSKKIQFEVLKPKIESENNSITIFNIFNQNENSLNSNLSEIESQETNENNSINLSFMIFNIYNFIISIPKFSELKRFNKTSKNSEIQINNIFMLENPDYLDYENIINLSNYEISEGVLNKSEILYFCFEKNVKYFYEVIITKIVNYVGSPEEIISNLLINLNKVILENLENPLIFSDFLINIYEKAQENDFKMQVLSLSGLFILITKYKLDYQNYYSMLYQSLSKNYYNGNKLNFIFDSKYRNRISKIFEISLKPSSVPILVILSFLKKLARICLYNSPSNIAVILGLIFNIVKNHPKALLLLIRKRKSFHTNKLKSDSKFLSIKRNRQELIKNEISAEKVENKNEINNFIYFDTEIVCEQLEEEKEDFEKLFCQYDQFKENELNPYKTDAEKSCLWELYSLKNHYNFKIRSLVHKFERNFLKNKEFDISSISSLKDDDLLYEINEKAIFYLNANAKKEEIKNNINKKFEELL